MGGIRKLALWAVLIASVAATIYGFYERKLFAQAIWDRAGIERFLLFAAGYILCFAIFSLWKPALFVPAVLGLVAVYTVLAVGFVAPLSVTLFLLSSGVLGQSVLKRTAADDPGVVLSILLGVAVYMFIVSLAVFVPVNYALTYLVALLAPLLWNRGTTLTWLSKLKSLFRPFPFKSRTEQLAAGALIFVLLAHWLITLLPEAGSDALAMHLVVPASVASAHKWAFDFKDHVWALMPLGGDWCSTVVYLLGGEAAARLLNLAFLGAIVALLASRRSFFPAALFAAAPIVQLVTGSLFVENLWALLAFGSFISLARYHENRRPPYLYLSFILLGAAAATKFGAFAFVVPIGVLAVIILLRDTQRAVKTLIAAAAFLIFASPPYLTAYAKTGNPVYPFFDPVNGVVDYRFKAPLTITTPYDLTFHTSHFMEGQDGAAGFQYLLLLPLGLLLLDRKWPFIAVAVAIVGSVFALTTFKTGPNLRYLYPAMAFATVFIAHSLAVLKTLDVWLYRAAVTLAAAMFCLDIYFLPSSGWYHKDFILNSTSNRARSEYLTAHEPVRNLIAYLNAKHPGVPVGFVETNAIAGLHAPAFTTMWHTPDFFKRVAAAESEQECLQIMRRFRIRFLIAPAIGSHMEINNVALSVFLANCTDPEFTSGRFYVARLREGDSCASTLSLRPGRYEDVDAGVGYQGAWKRGRFDGASNRTLTFTNDPDASFVCRFSGTEVTYIYTKAFNRGVAEIAIDGITQGRVDLRSTSIVWQSATHFQCNRAGPHIIQVRNTGSAFIDLDALEIR